MPILDNQGFIHFLKWKINIIDFLCLLFVICLLPALWFGWKIFNTPPPPPQPPLLINWEQKYNEIVAQQEAIFKKHPRIKKYLK